MATYCPNITTLKLEGCQDITYEFIKPLGKNCRQLSVLNIGHCPKVTEKIIKKFTRHDQKYDFKLTALDISGLALTNKSLDSLGTYQGKTLTTLDLGLCKGIAKEEVKAFKIIYPDLKKEAFKWFTLTANQGSSSAEHRLGLCYENGVGVQKDEKEAIKWYTLAAKGNGDAQFRLDSIANTSTKKIKLIFLN